MSRRSKRGKDDAEELDAVERADDGASTRRSSRNVRSVYATNTLKQQQQKAKTTTEKPKATPTKRTLKRQEVDIQEHADTNDATEAEKKTVVTPLPSPPTVRTEKPTRKRRPGGRPARSSVGSSCSNLTTRLAMKRSLLGKYTSNEATQLCQVILDHLRENTCHPNVLERKESPAAIDWQVVSQRLQEAHEVEISPTACQQLWKFLAYAHEPSDTTELVMSDAEDFGMSVEAVQAKYHQDQSKRSKPTPLETAETEASALRLFPQHELPSLNEDSGLCAIRSLPFPLVASNFLRKKKPVAAPTPSLSSS